MIGHLAENLENFQEDEHWKDEHYIWLNDFLTEQGPGTIFFWNDFDGSLALRVSTTQPPLYYDQGVNPNEY
jgi:hypothetical protein